MKKSWLFWFSLTSWAWAQEPLALVNATVYGAPAQATVVLRQGRIQSLGQAPPADCKVVNLQGLYLYPGLVESDSTLGLIETDSVRATVDVAEVGGNNADLQAEIGFNPDSELLPVARSAGVLTVALQPTGGRICGQVGVLQIWGWSPDEMRRIPSPGVVVMWPNWPSGEVEKARAKWRQELGRLEDWIEEAQAWDQLPPGERPVRPELTALTPVVNGTGKLFIRAQSRFQIESAAEFCQRHQLRWVLVGGAEADQCVAKLAEQKVDVIYTEAYRLPRRDDEDFDRYFRIPSVLTQAGLRVALAGPSSHDNARWLTEMAAACSAHGWGPKAAIDAITRVPCEILGMPAQGTLEENQAATLIACSGPLLDGRSRVVRAWVQGQEIDLSDRQKRLWEKYRNKPRLTVPRSGGENSQMIPDRLPPAQSLRPKRPSSPGPAPQEETYQPGPPAWGHSLTGDVRYHEVTSKLLDNTRQVWVYLPPNYHQNPDKKYPVLYAMDGQNVFERGTAFGGQEWKMDEAAQRAMTQGTMQEAIVVAVSNAGAKRLEEYSHVPDPSHGGGGAEKFAQFLKTELKPMIDGAYRTELAPEKTGILGSSMGGLVSLYAGLAHSNTFGLIGVLSPSLWWAEKDMIRMWAENPPEFRPSRIWLDMGDRESQTDKDSNGVADVLDNTRALRDILQAQGQQGLLYQEISGGTHTEGAWSQRIQSVLEGLLPPS